MGRIIVLFFLGLLAIGQVRAQVVNTATADTSSGEHIGRVTIAAMIDSYYGYCLNPTNENTVPFFVSSSRHNEVNVNLAFLDVRFQNKNFRGRLMPAFGTHMNANFAAEPAGLNNALEAHAGFRVFPKKNIWLDAGILGSPYTNESAVSKDHAMYTRSLAPEFVPYYLGGAKLTLPVNKKINLYIYALNGWQQIKDQNETKALGTQLEITVNDKNLVNWNTFTGNERTPSAPTYRNRYFSDIYWLYNSGKKFSFSTCAYYGLQEVEVSSGIYEMRSWWQANFIAKYKLSDLFSLSGRLEYFSDTYNIMIPALNQVAGFDCFGSSLSFAYHFSDRGMFRLEARNFLTKELLFRDSANFRTNYLNWFVSNITIWF